MCYPKPGPRCSSHATKALQKATAKYTKEGTYDSYAAMRDAQKDYEMTPAGQDSLRRKFDKETDFSKKYELQERLERAITLRKEALAAIKSEDKGDVRSAEELEAEQVEKTKKFAGAPQDPLGVSPFQNPFKYGEGGTEGVDYDYDDYRCADDNCSGYYCHDKEYEGLRAAPIKSRAYLAANFGVDEDQVPDEWVSRMNALDLNSSIRVEGERDYYGEQVAVYVDPEVQEELASMYYSLPNATDEDRGLNYAREEGVDTTGLTPVEAVKQSLPEMSHTASIKKQIDKSSKVSREAIRMEAVKFDQKALEASPSYDFSKSTATGHAAPSAGVLLPDPKDPARFTLVGGYERFKAAQAKGNKKWTFHVLTS